jgi:hypothetical protein
MKRTIVEVILALALVGAGAFGWTNWKGNQSATGQVTELKAASEEAAKAATEKEAAVKAAEEEMAALRAEMAPLEGQAQQLAAVKAAMANGATLADLEAAYKTQKNLSAERQVGLGALRMLTKGAEDPAAMEAFRKALQLSELGDRKTPFVRPRLGWRRQAKRSPSWPTACPRRLKVAMVRPAKSHLPKRATARPKVTVTASPMIRRRPKSMPSTGAMTAKWGPSVGAKNSPPAPKANLSLRWTFAGPL